MLAVMVEYLTKHFGQIQALAGVDLKIEPGEIFGLLGPDGAGKSTLIKILATLLSPSSGKVHILGHDALRQPEPVRRQIGYMPQTFSLYTELTVAENLDFFFDLHQVEATKRAARLRELMSFSQLAPFKNRLAGQLSGGMKQKLALSCALIHTPKILFLDEPSTGIDPVSRYELWKLLYEICQQGVTLVVATPNLEEAERCSRLALMDRGLLLGCGSPAQLRAELKQQVWELELSDPLRAMELLNRWPLVRNLKRQGTRILLYLDDVSKQVPAVRRLLRQNGISLISQQLHEPNLEDVLRWHLQRSRSQP